MFPSRSCTTAPIGRSPLWRSIGRSQSTPGRLARFSRARPQVTGASSARCSSMRMLTVRFPAAVLCRICCSASGGIRLRVRSWVTRARVRPSRRAMSARRRDESLASSAIQDLARTSASVSGSFHWSTGVGASFAGSGKGNSIGATEKGKMPDFWSGMPTLKTADGWTWESSYVAVLRPAILDWIRTFEYRFGRFCGLDASSGAGVDA